MVDCDECVATRQVYFASDAGERHGEQLPWPVPVGQWRRVLQVFVHGVADLLDELGDSFEPVTEPVAFSLLPVAFAFGACLAPVGFCR
jgi:hypothetical protein